MASDAMAQLVKAFVAVFGKTAGDKQIAGGNKGGFRHESISCSICVSDKVQADLAESLYLKTGIS
jgi:hypothetical protein